LTGTWYGNRVRLTVTGASGSSAERKSRKIRLPRRAPKRSRRAWRISENWSSAPPPLPKMPPTSDAVAITSVAFHGAGPSGRPIAAYSPGIFVMSSRASPMYLLMPAM
jgi:hypothetical protein